MNIDENAPAVAHDSILIDAPIEKVWAIETDINHWAEWQPDVSSAKLDGDLRSGNVFRWKAAGLSITSTLRVVKPYEQIGWTGDSLGMKAVHIWHFVPEEGGTRVKVDESLSGWLTRLMCLFDRQFLQKSMAKSLLTLKEHVESVA